jgi:hypothetical protein
MDFNGRRTKWDIRFSFSTYTSIERKKRRKKIVFEIVGRNHQRVLTDVSRYSLYFAFLS